MTSKRLYFLLLGIIGLLLIGLVAGTYGANSLLTNQADKLTALKAKSQALDQEQVIFNQAKKDIAKYSSLQKIAKAVVPQDKNQAEAVREIVNIAATNNVQLSSITFPASTLGTTTLPIKPGATTAPSPVANPNAGKLSQLTAVKNIPGVYQLPITVTSDPNNPVQYSKFISFLNDLEHNRRTAQVSSITIQPTQNNRNFLSFSLSLNEYIKP